MIIVMIQLKSGQTCKLATDNDENADRICKHLFQCMRNSQDFQVGPADSPVVFVKSKNLMGWFVQEMKEASQIQTV